MPRASWTVLGAGCALLLAGCRAATKVVDVPRVDLELAGGNRGYLIGSPPEAGELKTTRQMMEATVEVPSFYKPKRLGAPVGGGVPVAPEGLMPSEPETAGEPQAPPQRYDSYVVQKGDSLWSIAAKPEVYGKATYWRRLFDANRDLLKSPDHLKAGMTLKIPRGGEGAGETMYDDEGISYKK
ncbi:MAG: LysM peptidoglycan-binding domain-containing protein [Candidatus Omnitrophica bacterium]|nr:LysM peptidoglycan-binding domain-containing protein [Candidatus Omnitrophota bacterium]